MVHILAVDDDPVFRAFLEKTFADSRFNITTEENPETVVSLAKQLEPGLIILDFEMPQMTGVEAFQTLQADPATADIPVWMCSSLDDEGLMADAYELGIADYVVKPISARAFRAKVEQKLSHSTRVVERAQLNRTFQSLKTAQVHVNQMMPKVPEIEGLELGLIYKAAEEVGGDFYDFFTTERQTTVFVVGDVTGHGIEAAVIQTMARKLIQVLVRFGESIEHGLQAANEELMKDLPKGNFVALTMCEWFPESRTLRYYRLGLPHPVLRKADGKVRVLMSGGTILGMHPAERFASLLSANDVVLEPGDSVLIHSDGAIEAPLPTGNDLGFEGLRKIIRDANPATAQTLADTAWDAIVEQCGKGVDADDITFLVVRAV